MTDWNCFFVAPWRRVKKRKFRFYSQEKRWKTLKSQSDRTNGKYRYRGKVPARSRGRRTQLLHCFHTDPQEEEARKCHLKLSKEQSHPKNQHTAHPEDSSHFWCNKPHQCRRGPSCHSLCLSVLWQGNNLRGNLVFKTKLPWEPDNKEQS